METYKPNYNSSIERLPMGNRIAAALREAPINGILAVDGQLTSWYIEKDEAVNQACQIHNICNHGFINHLLPVIQNVFKLKDIVNKGIYKNNKVVLEKGLFSNEFSDGDTAGSLFIHDLIYGNKSVIWNGYHIDRHEKMAVLY